MELSSNLDVLGAILQICLIDLLLSGDNAILIALASAGLPETLRPRAVVLGTAAAVLFRVMLTFAATLALRAPYLKLVGAGLLLLIAIELLASDSAAQHARAQRAPDGGLWRAIVIIVAADAVMSLDNVVAVAAAAQDNFLFLVLGLLISVPLLVFSSLFITGLLARYPVLVEAGAALLGWIAGKTAVSDPAIAGVLDTQSFGLVTAAPLLGALYVWTQGRRLRAQRAGPGAVAAPDVAPLPVPARAALVTAGPAPQLRAARPVPGVGDTLPAPALPPVPTAAARPTAAPYGAPPAPSAAAPGPATGGTAAPRRFSPMDLTILAGVAVPLLGFVVMIVYFVVHAATAH